jgi:hypothetical protein
MNRIRIPEPPGPLEPTARVVWDRIAPHLVGRGRLHTRRQRGALVGIAGVIDWVTRPGKELPAPVTAQLLSTAISSARWCGFVGRDATIDLEPAGARQLLELLTGEPCQGRGEGPSA